MVDGNAGLPPKRRIEFRVGIHGGDVVGERWRPDGRRRHTSSPPAPAVRPVSRRQDAINIAGRDTIPSTELELSGRGTSARQQSAAVENRMEHLSKLIDADNPLLGKSADQFGYVVPDLEQAIKGWIDQGVGPWFTAGPVVVTDNK